MTEYPSNRLDEIRDRSLNKRELKKELEVGSDGELFAKLATMTEEESLAWQKKLNFGDFALLRGALGGIAYRAEKAKNLGPEGVGILDGLAPAAGLATGALAVEAGMRINELVGGSEQSYNANLSLGDLQSAFEAALQGSDITLKRSMAEFILNKEGKELLKVQVNNSDEEARRDETPYDAYGSRIVGRCSVRITKSDLLSLAGEGIDAAKDVASSLSRLGESSSIMDVLNMAMTGFAVGKEVLDVANLPNLLATEVEKLAQEAEQLARQKTDEIRSRNRDRFDEVKKGLECEACDTARPSKETISCEACGYTLSVRAESVASLEADKLKLAEIGLTF